MKKSNFLSFLLLVSLLFALASNPQSGWVQVTSPQTGYDLYGIYFKDINTGVCTNYKTTNGGTSWYQTATSGNYAMFFIDQSTGFRTGSGIVKTTNLGENWISQTNPAGILYGVHFVDINTGFACGELAKIVKTTSGGTSWTLLTSPVSSSYYLNGVYFVDANTGFIAKQLTAGQIGVFKISLLKQVIGQFSS